VGGMLNFPNATDYLVKIIQKIQAQQTHPWVYRQEYVD
jgi:hypothetical protein